MIKALFNNNTFAVLSSSDILADGKEYFLEIKKPKRTVKQNSLFWAIVKILADWQGEENVKDFKESLMFQIGHTRVRIDTFTGEEKTESARTHDLSKMDFADLIDKIKIFADKHGVRIPDIEEYFSKNNNNNNGNTRHSIQKISNKGI